jgi:hypothetical protein
VLGKLRKRVVVMASLVPRYELGPSDDRLLALIKKRTFEITVGTEGIELLLGPACCSPD